jgi:hypothetical protein
MKTALLVSKEIRSESGPANHRHLLDEQYAKTEHSLAQLFGQRLPKTLERFATKAKDLHVVARRCL